MFERVANLTISTVFIGAAAFLVYSGYLNLFVHPRYFLFTQAFVYTAFVFSLTGLVYTLISSKGQDYKHLLSSFNWRYYSFAILPMLLVSIFGFIHEFNPLTSATLSQRVAEVNFIQGSSDLDVFELFKRPSEDLGLQEWVFLIQSQPDLESFVGDKVILEGFIYADEAMLEDRFLLSKFVISCCTVDARPLGLEVEAEDWDRDYGLDQWVRVEGVYRYDDESEELYIDPINIEKIDIPDDPYIY